MNERCLIRSEHRQTKPSQVRGAAVKTRVRSFTERDFNPPALRLLHAVEDRPHDAAHDTAFDAFAVPGWQVVLQLVGEA